MNVAFTLGKTDQLHQIEQFLYREARYADVQVLARSKRAVNQLAHVFRALGVPYARAGSSSHPLRALRALATGKRHRPPCESLLCDYTVRSCARKRACSYK